ncbi:uncharacterized protein LOC144860918 [Branchiostoma floridae x Branchiostoma japonicum]
MKKYLFVGAVFCTLAASAARTCEWAYSCEWETQCCRKDDKPFSVYWYPGLALTGLGECGDLGQENEECFTGMSIDYCNCAEGLTCRPETPGSDVVIGFFTYVKHACQRDLQ